MHSTARRFGRQACAGERKLSGRGENHRGRVMLLGKNDAASIPNARRDTVVYLQTESQILCRNFISDQREWW